MSKRVSKHILKPLIGRPKKAQTKKKISITLDPLANEIASKASHGERSSKISQAIILCRHIFNV
jgi:hypothetical protein